MQHFCYPEEDHELLNHEYVRDFLRNPSDFPKNVDLNYLRNQRDAVNYFIDWFKNGDDQGYVEMLRKCHELAALGRSEICIYKICWNDQWLIPSVTDDGIVTFETQNPEMFRETHPGVFRSELLEAGIPHPGRDIFELTANEFKVLSNLGKESFDSELEWCCATGRPRRKLGSIGKYSINFQKEGASLEVTVTESGTLECHNPTGKDYQLMRELCETKICEIRRHWNPEKRDEMITLISSYYHASINWMPFSNINNSILMAQMNYFRRRLGVEPLAHNNLDTLALLTSSNGFLQLIR